MELTTNLHFVLLAIVHGALLPLLGAWTQLNLFYFE